VLGARAPFLGRGAGGWTQPVACLLERGSGLLGQRPDQLAGRQLAAQLIGLASPQVDQPQVAGGPSGLAQGGGQVVELGGRRPARQCCAGPGTGCGFRGPAGR
jgi:hypothetical protein